MNIQDILNQQQLLINKYINMNKQGNKKAKDDPEFYGKVIAAFGSWDNLEAQAKIITQQLKEVNKKINQDKSLKLTQEQPEEKKLIDELKRRYLRNEPVTEQEIVQNDLEFFRKVIDAFGSWSKFEKKIGLLQRHLQERTRYFLYYTMLLRSQSEYGNERLRYKNIEPEMKKEIKKNFGTILKLTENIINGWSQDRVIFEAHTYFITGGLAQNLEAEKPELFEMIKLYFRDVNHFYEEYEKRFLIQPLNEVVVEAAGYSTDSAEESVNNVAQTSNQETEPTKEEISTPAASKQSSKKRGFDINSLVKAGYMSEDALKEVKEAASKSKEEVVDFVLGLDTQVTDQELSSTNRKMWLAVKNNFGDLESARIAATEQQKQA